MRRRRVPIYWTTEDAACCRDWSNAFHRSDLLAERIASMDLLNLLFHLVDALFQRAEFLVERGQKLSTKGA